MSIRRSVDVYVDLTPAELAQVFCEMGDVLQAQFFNEVYERSIDWLPMQLQFITDTEALNSGGRYVMGQIGDYASPETATPKATLDTL